MVRPHHDRLSSPPMRLYRYWVRHDEPDDRWPVSCWGGSERSADEARARAAERARSTLRRLRAGETPSRYPYGVQPLREEIVEEIPGAGGAAAAVITRNGYGALVLNTAGVLFADVDLPPKPAGVGALLGRLFGKRQAEPDVTAETIERIEAVAAGGLGLRLYRTCAGFRCLATGGLFDPIAATTIDLLARLGSDPLYVRLCRAQACFRARLTPKPWRCGIPTPPVSFPFEDDRAQTLYRQWEKSYHDRTGSRPTCFFVGSMGATGVHPDVAPIVELHDRWTVGEGDLA